MNIEAKEALYWKKNLAVFQFYRQKTLILISIISNMSLEKDLFPILAKEKVLGQKI